MRSFITAEDSRTSFLSRQCLGRDEISFSSWSVTFYIIDEASCREELRWTLATFICVKPGTINTRRSSDVRVGFSTNISLAWFVLRFLPDRWTFGCEAVIYRERVIIRSKARLSDSEFVIKSCKSQREFYSLVLIVNKRLKIPKRNPKRKNGCIVSCCPLILKYLKPIRKYLFLHAYWKDISSLSKREKQFIQHKITQSLKPICIWVLSSLFSIRGVRVIIKILWILLYCLVRYFHCSWAYCPIAFICFIHPMKKC
jgi:hypothetical protein